MDAIIKKAYNVERYNEPCQHCGKGESWVIVGPDGYASGEIYDDKEFCDWLAEELNNAYVAAISS